MKVSFDWLSDFVDWIERDPAIIADRLTAAVGEVDDLIVQGAQLDHCVVGKVTNFRKHPGADKLLLCDVTTERGAKKVVCGGTNLREGMLVAFAHVGATVRWHGGEAVTLQATKIRGEQSEGMICAAEEIGLADMFPVKPNDGERPIVDLGAISAKPGTPLREALGMTDVVFHIDNHAITHRPDLFSHVGIARELVALGVAKWKKQPAKKKPVFPKATPPFTCKNDIPKLIPRYCSCLLSINSIGQTPEWMKRRLIATGWRPVSLPVDITNYVAMETGMPLHSFDAGDFKGNIVMRTAKKGESLVTLDGVKRNLNEGAIVIADDAGIFDLLGVMGGLRSSTKDSTKNIYLHSAIVDGTSIRRTIIATGHRTDASTVYEKGVPPVTAELGFFRALGLMLELIPGARIVSSLESWGSNGKPKAIPLSMTHVESMLGTKITGAQAKKILTDLECTVKTSGKNLSVTPPLHRIGDIRGEHDLIEEIGRIYGYQKIPAVMPQAPTVPPVRDTRLHAVRDTLQHDGFFETVHLAFTSAQTLKKIGDDPGQAVSLENPIGEESAYMRTSLLPSLLSTAAVQILNTDASTLKLYEFGSVFSKKEESTTLALVAASRTEPGLKSEPLLIVKSGLQHALRKTGYTMTVEKRTEKPLPIMHAGRCADALVGKTVVGALFELHPLLATSFGLPSRTAAAVIDWQRLMALKPDPKLFSMLPEFPAIAYDETVPVSATLQADSVLRDMSKISPLLKDVRIIDLYQDGKTKRMTLHFVYRADDRTLAQSETDVVHAKVVGELKRRLG